ncbi:diguanylate cyclase domain-containing protein [Sinisalibacter aestuarii]|uniref:GGDEF domain-containing protein n=1 Tax=Sinisalibacter aestuarii TaxID=2949426 RepID=A0ABQ5LUE6_9RHOB|nr:diguanylate cyclase [Sinisalibacter aestuarii]GKY88609.1 GGDEF domain-containing protein [Sinisalibacter aestuarii]
MTPPAALALSPDALDALMPMHARVCPDGVIQHAGPTLQKIFPAGPCIGQPFFALFEPRRPRDTTDFGQICAASGGRLSLRLRDAARTPLIGTAVQLADGRGVLINLSFGIAVIDAVAQFNLTGSDFAATDLTLELLYLVEANAAAMAESRELNERLQGAKVMAEAEAQSDTLTGLANRRALDQVLARQIARARPFALMHLDLDYFKQVNDTLGHAAGDAVLTHVAAILLEETRTGDAVARVGGDEFVLVISGLIDAPRLTALASRLIRRLEEPIGIGAREARISASIGIAVSTGYARPEARIMMHDADVALYASKARGRACFSFHEPESGSGPSDQSAAQPDKADIAAPLPSRGKR